MSQELEQLRGENARLRAEVESFRQREMEDLRQQLAEAKQQASHYRSEAERNAALGHQIHQGHVEEITRLRSRIQTLEQTYGQSLRFPNGVGQGSN